MALAAEEQIAILATILKIPDANLLEPKSHQRNLRSRRLNKMVNTRIRRLKVEVTKLVQEKEIKPKRVKEQVKEAVKRQVKEVKRTSFVGTSGIHKSMARAHTEDKLVTSVTAGRNLKDKNKAI